MSTKQVKGILKITYAYATLLGYRSLSAPIQVSLKSPTPLVRILSTRMSVVSPWIFTGQEHQAYQESLNKLSMQINFEEINYAKTNPFLCKDFISSSKLRKWKGFIESKQKSSNFLFTKYKEDKFE